MRRLAWVALAAAGCQEDRVERLARDVATLRAEVEDLERVTDHMRKALTRARAAVEREARAEPPEGFDFDRALPPGDTRRPDVILLSIDTLRADHLGAWGYARDTSPFLDQLASEGTRFANAWSAAPWTLPSHTTILSGRLPRHHGAIEDHVRIGDDIPLVQEFFRQSGYGTGGVVATLFVSSRFGFDRGFDFFHDFGIKGAKVNNSSTVDAEQVFAWALDWAQDQPAGKPLFLFLHVYDAHYAYNAPSPWDEKFDRPVRVGDAVYSSYQAYKRHPLSDAQMDHQIAQYDEEIAYVDHEFGRMIQKWKLERPNLVVAVTADHGEEFGERGSWGHAHTLYPEQLHVPWLVAGPGVKRQIVEDRVGSEDIAVTLARMADVPFVSPDGIDRSSQLRGASSATAFGATSRAHVSGRFAETSRFQTLRYRWHEPPHDLYVDLNKGSPQLCDLTADPMCETNLWTEDEARARALAASMSEWLGQDWEALAEGEVVVQGGQIFQGTEKAKKASLHVVAGDRFAVHPADAFVKFLPAGGKGKGSEQGPWRIVGGAAPGDSDPLAFHGNVSANAAIDLSDEEKEMLEALGYLQDH